MGPVTCSERHGHRFTIDLARALVFERQFARESANSAGTALCRAVRSQSVFLNGARAGALASRAGKSRTKAIIDGCQNALNPK